MDKIIIAALLLFLLSKKGKASGPEEKTEEASEATSKGFTDAQRIEQAFKKVASEYGVEFARQLERLYRLETGHFKSASHKKTGAAGMVATSKDFPFGWPSLLQWSNEKGISPNLFFIDTKKEGGTGKMVDIVGFPNIESAIDFHAWFIANVRNGKFELWHSLTNKEKQRKYLQALSTIKARFN